MTSEKDISQKLAETFSKHSSSTNYGPQFQNIKNKKEKTKLSFRSKNLEDYNHAFSLEELKKLLGKAQVTACGHDEIHYKLLKHLPDIGLQTL